MRTLRVATNGLITVRQRNCWKGWKVMFSVVSVRNSVNRGYGNTHVTITPWTSLHRVTQPWAPDIGALPQFWSPWAWEPAPQPWLCSLQVTFGGHHCKSVQTRSLDLTVLGPTWQAGGTYPTGMPMVSWFNLRFKTVVKFNSQEVRFNESPK